MDNGILALAAMASVLCNASEYHHLNIGPEAFIVTNNKKYLENSWSKHATFGGLNACYEYLEPNTFYVAGDWKYCVGSMNVKQIRNFPARNYRTDRDFEMAFRSIEGKIGYNFLVHRDFMVTPYMGWGSRAYRARSNDTARPIRMRISDVYMTQGVRTEYIFSERLRMGVCLKNFCSMTGESRSNTYYQYLNALNGGVEMSFPLSVRCHGSSKSYVFKVEPYFRKDNINNCELTIGTTLKLSCDF